MGESHSGFLLSSCNIKPQAKKTISFRYVEEEVRKSGDIARKGKIRRQKCDYRKRNPIPLLPQSHYYSNEFVLVGV